MGCTHFYPLWLTLSFACPPEILGRPSWVHFELIDCRRNLHMCGRSSHHLHYK